MSTNEPNTASPVDVTEMTVDEIRGDLADNEYSDVELRAMLNDEENRTDQEPRSTATEAIGYALDDAVTSGSGEDGPQDEEGSDGDEADANAAGEATGPDAVAEAMNSSEYVVGQTVTIRPVGGDPYVAGEWFDDDDGEGERDVTYNRRVAKAVGDGIAEIVGSETPE